MSSPYGREGDGGGARTSVGSSKELSGFPPRLTSQTLSVWSSAAVATRWPSDEKEQEHTTDVCPERMWITERPSVMESSKTLQSPPDIPTNTRFTLGEIATHVIGDGRPSSSSSWISNILT